MKLSRKLQQKPIEGGVDHLQMEALTRSLGIQRSDSNRILASFTSKYSLKVRNFQLESV